MAAILSIRRAAAAVACATLTVGIVLLAQDGEWPAYGRDAGGERFSPLDAIRRENVASLEVAWTFRTGECTAPAGAHGIRRRRLRGRDAV